MSERVANLSNPFHGRLILTQFIGPKNIVSGCDERRCLQIGDHLKLSAPDVRELIDELEQWMGSLEEGGSDA